MEDVNNNLKDLIKIALPILTAENDFYEFVKQAWVIVEPSEPFVDGIHIQAFCAHLQLVSKGKLKRIIYNGPPRCSKSTIGCVMWPAWDLIKNPWRKFLFAAHSYDLSTRDSIRCKKLIESEWYQHRWGHKFKLTKNTEKYFETDYGGFRKSTSVGSKVTGGNADFIGADDLNDTTDVFSEKIREKTNMWFSGTLSMRLNNRKTGAIVLMGQRCHEMDVTGFILSSKKHKYTHIMLPMEFEPARKCVTVPLKEGEKPWEDPRTERGQLLWPERIGKVELDEIKSDLRTSYRIAGQLQQHPAPEEGGLIKKNYFQWWKKPKPPKLKEIIQSWDTALTDDDRKKGAFNACTTWGIFDDFGDDENNNSGVENVILLATWHGRIEYPDLRKMAQRLAIDYKDTGEQYREPDGNHTPDYVLIESKSSGTPLIQDLRRAGIMAVGFDPSKFGDKNQRVAHCTPMMECGRVWLPASPYTGYKSLLPFAEEFMQQCILFPNGDSRDFVDSMSQVLLRLIYRIRNANDPKELRHKKYKKKVFY